MPKISYTDKVAPVQPDGTVAAFMVKSVESIKMYNPTVTAEELKKLRKKIDALKITLSLVAGESDPYPFVDFVYLISGWMGKFDALRIACGELIASRDDYDTDDLIGKEGVLILSEKDGKNFVGKYLSPDEPEDDK